MPRADYLDLEFRHKLKFVFSKTTDRESQKCPYVRECIAVNLTTTVQPTINSPDKRILSLAKKTFTLHTLY